MKCSKCYINYDDSEKECPFCGAKAGVQQTRTVRWKDETEQPVPPYTRAKGTAERTPKANPNLTRPMPFNIPAKTKQAKTSRKSIVWAILVFIIAIAAEVAPNIMDRIDTVDYEIDTLYEYTAAYEFLGEQSFSVLGDNEMLAMQFLEDESYLFSYMQADGSIYYETGETYSEQVLSQEWMEESDFPPAQYDWYYLSFWQAENEIISSADGADVSALKEYAQDEVDLMVTVYIDRDTGDIYFENTERIEAPFFKENHVIQIMKDTISDTQTTAPNVDSEQFSYDMVSAFL